MIVEGRLLIEPERAPVAGWVTIDGTTIAEVGVGRPPARADLGGPDAIVCPGFVDAHVHLPQIDSIGCDAGDLLEWLDQVIFPAERRWGDAATARAQVRVAHARMLRSGTVAYAGYLTSHPHGVDAVAAEHDRYPLHATVGASLMDCNGPADLVGQPVALPPPPSGDRRRASVNPRYAIVCSEDLLARAGRAATATGAFVQTHLAEQLRECERVRDLFPDDPSYAAVYDRFGLLGERTILAHCIHLDDREWALLAERRAVVAHCPAANTFLRSGLFDLDAARAHGVRLALGSDVAAGPDLAMPRVARAMIEVAKIRAMTGGARAVPTPAEAWRLITEGNADALGLPGAGRLAEGAAADLLVLEPPLAVDEHFVGRLIYTWRDDFITHRILNGALVAPGDLESDAALSREDRP